MQMAEFLKQGINLLSTVLSMNPFSLYWKSSWAASSLASPPGNTTRLCKWMLAWHALSHRREEPDTSYSMNCTLRGMHTNTPTQLIAGARARVPKQTDACLIRSGCITQGGALPSSATLVVSLKLLQWLRVSMEASSSLKGCTCPCCPPGGEKEMNEFSTINSKCVCTACLCALCNPRSTQVV